MQQAAMNSPYQLDILGTNAVPINLDVVIILTKENSKSIDEETKEKCKILKFSSEWKFDEIFSTISGLESQNYPNLFIFIINDKSFGFFELSEEKLPEKVEILQENLLKFNKNRSIILQLTSEDENVTKFYYNGENSEEFNEIKEQTTETEDFVDFSSFLWLFLNENIEDFEYLMLENLPEVENSLLVLKFLRILRFSKDFFDGLVVRCAAKGSLSDFLAAVDEYAAEDAKMQESKQIDILSVLWIALEKSNQEIVDFLMKNYKNSIQLLSYEEKVEISTTAFKTSQIEVLCDLLEFFDFPFPYYFDPDAVDDERICRIIDVRENFHEDVLAENLSGIERFLKENSNLKFAYNVDNRSAICNALDSKKFQSFFHIMEISFQILDAEALKQFILENGVFISVFCSALDVEGIEKFIGITQRRTDSNFIREMLKLEGKYGENLLFKLVRSESITVQKFRKILQILEKYLDSNEITELMTVRNDYGYNILHTYTAYANPRMLAILFAVLRDYFNSMNIPNDFVAIVSQRTSSHTHQNILHISAAWEDKESHQTLWRLLLKTFENREELKDLIMQKDDYEDNFVHKLIRNGTASTIEFIFNKIEEFFRVDDLKEILNLKGWNGRTLLQHAACEVKNIQFHQTLWKIVQKHFDSSEILDMVQHADRFEDNLLIIAVKNNTKEVVELTWNEIRSIFSSYEAVELINFLKCGENIFDALIGTDNKEMLKYLWKDLENHFRKQDLLPQLMKLATKKPLGYHQNILVAAAFFGSIEFNETLWELLLDTFEDREEIKNLLMQTNDDGINSVHQFVTSCDIIELTLKKAKENFSDPQYRQIIKSKGFKGRNLLQSAATRYTYDGVYKYLWNAVRDFCKSDEEFLKILKEVDSQNNNVFHLATIAPSSEVFNFLIREVEKIASPPEIRKILSTLGQSSSNLLQSAAKQSKLLELHQILWETIHKYFDSSEILSLVKHYDENGYNFLFCAVKCNTKQVVEVTWNEIKNVFNENEDADLTEHLKCIKDDGENILHALFKAEDEEKLKFLWTELENYFKSQSSSEQFKELLSQKTSEEEHDCLNIASNCDKIEFHEALWKLLLNTFDNREELKDLMLQGNKYGSNFIHNLVPRNTADILEFTFKKLKENFSIVQYEEILKSKGQWGRNLLQKAACSSKDVKTHQILWKTFRYFCKTDENYLKFLKEVDEIGSNVLHLAAAFSTSDILEFMIRKLEKITPKGEIKNLLTTSGHWKENILQAAMTYNKSLDLHEMLWKVIQKHFFPSEIVQMINYCDKDGDNILHNAVHWNTKEVAEFTWKQIQKFVTTKDDQVEYLSRKGL